MKIMVIVLLGLYFVKTASAESLRSDSTSYFECGAAYDIGYARQTVWGGPQPTLQLAQQSAMQHCKQDSPVPWTCTVVTCFKAPTK